MSDELQAELETYNKLLPELLKDEGKFALIHDGDLQGIYETYDDALQVGYDQFGVDSVFLVKKILASEQVQYFSRDIDFSCRA